MGEIWFEGTATAAPDSAQMLRLPSANELLSIQIHSDDEYPRSIDLPTGDVAFPRDDRAAVQAGAAGWSSLLAYPQSAPSPGVLRAIVVGSSPHRMDTRS
jgi:hypothetical protein